MEGQGEKGSHVVSARVALDVAIIKLLLLEAAAGTNVYALFT